MQEPWWATANRVYVLFPGITDVSCQRDTLVNTILSYQSPSLPCHCAAVAWCHILMKNRRGLITDTIVNRHYVKYISCIISHNPHHNPQKKQQHPTIVMLIFRWGNWGSEVLISKGTQPIWFWCQTQILATMYSKALTTADLLDISTKYLTAKSYNL